MPIKTFRGLIADGAQDTIVLHTSDGSTGYRIVKFQLMPNEMGSSSNEHTVQIWKEFQTAITATIDFSNNRLLAAATTTNNPNGYQYPPSTQVIFDNEIFNQDIYITHVETSLAEPVNYYIELEQMSLDLTENTVATLKNIRNVTSGL